MSILSEFADGDARVALGALEMAEEAAAQDDDGVKHISTAAIKVPDIRFQRRYVEWRVISWAREGQEEDRGGGVM